MRPNAWDARAREGNTIAASASAKRVSRLIGIRLRSDQKSAPGERRLDRWSLSYQSSLVKIREGEVSCRREPLRTRPALREFKTIAEKKRVTSP